MTALVPELVSSRRRVRPTREGELLVRSLWRSLPYQVFGTCATCGSTRDDEGHHLFVAGVNPDSRVCIKCFELEHGCRAPNYRRRQSRLLLDPQQDVETYH